MKKTISIGIFLVLITTIFLPLLSSEIILEKQPEEIYNLGDMISIPITIKASEDISGTLNVNLICRGEEINFYKNGISLEYGKELKINPSLLLNRETIGETTGNCKIKAILGDETAITEEFKISDLIEISLRKINEEFSPEKDYLIGGEAKREDGSDFNGLIDMQIIIEDEEETSSINKSGTVNEGYFSFNFSLPENTSSGSQLLKLKAYEKVDGEITNKGTKIYDIQIKQIPTNLEIVFESSEINPGEILKFKAVLRDQTGKSIDSNVNFKIKNSNKILIGEIEGITEEYFEYQTVYNQPPERWEVLANSRDLSTKKEFEILPLEKVDIELVNKTVIVENIGNVPYNKTVSVKIGDQIQEIEVSLDVDETEKYFLYAPNGEYNIEILKGDGSILSGTAVLTGNAIDIRKASDGVKGIIRYPISWIFLIAILGFFAIVIFKKNYKGNFKEKLKIKNRGINENKKVKEKPSKKEDKNSLINPSNIAELSLSIKGDIQRVSLVGLKIKNVSEVKSNKSAFSETFKKVVEIAEEKKAYVYKNQEYIFFVFAPVITKTFKNEKAAISISQEIKNVLKEHNKKFKKKVNFGMAINSGEIVAKLSGGKLKFMSMKTLIPGTKKIAGESTEEILLSKKFNDKLDSSVKTEKHKEHYKIKEIIDKGEHKAFISSFLKRMEHDKKDSNKRN